MMGMTRVGWTSTMPERARPQRPLKLPAWMAPAFRRKAAGSVMRVAGVSSTQNVCGRHSEGSRTMRSCTS